MTTAPPTTLAPTTTATTACNVNNTDFSEYGATPSDWTEEWNPGSAIPSIITSGLDYGGKYMQLFNGGFPAEYGISWDDIGDVSNVDILCRMQTSLNADDSAWVVARGGGGAGTEDGYIASLDISSDEISIKKLDNGSISTLVNTSLSLAVSTWYWIRFRVQGNTLKMKGWAGAIDDEPGTWDLETTDGDFTTGWVGVGHQNGNGSMSQRVDLFYCSEGGCLVEDPGTLTTVSTTPAPTTSAPTTLPTTAAPTTLPTTSPPTTSAPTTLPTTSAPTTIVTTSAPTTLPTTSPPTTAAPTTIVTTAGPTTIVTTAAPTTLATSPAPTTLATTAQPTTIVTTAAPTTIGTTAAPTTTLTTLAPTTLDRIIIDLNSYIRTEV